MGRRLQLGDGFIYFTFSSLMIQVLVFRTIVDSTLANLTLEFPEVAVFLL